MSCIGVVLTGGSSRRMGRDKATLVGHDSGRSLAGRTAELLAACTDPTIELGPGISPLPARPDPQPGAGPLVALAGAWELWATLDPSSHVVVVATDLPRLTAGFLRWLIGHPVPTAVVATDRGRPQPLCARYRASDLTMVAPLVDGGERRIMAWLGTVEYHPAPPSEWAVAAGDDLALRDVDTPADLAALRADSA